MPVFLIWLWKLQYSWQKGCFSYVLNEKTNKQKKQPTVSPVIFQPPLIIPESSMDSVMRQH